MSNEPKKDASDWLAELLNFKSLSNHQRLTIATLFASIFLDLTVAETHNDTITVWTVAIGALVTFYVYLMSEYQSANALEIQIRESAELLEKRVREASEKDECYFSELKEIERLNSIDRHDSANMQFIGNSRDGIEWVKRHNKGLHHVYNTVHRPRSSDHRFVQEAYPGYLAAIREAIGAGAAWHDLLLPTHDPLPVADFIRSLSDVERRAYEVKELVGLDDLPMFQITILQYHQTPDRDAHSVVSFGYAFPGCKTLRVWNSSDANNVRFFEEYLMALYNGKYARSIYSRGEPLTDELRALLKE